MLEDDHTFHLVRPTDDLDEVKSKRGSMKDKAMTKAITEIYLTRLLSVKVSCPQPATGGRQRDTLAPSSRFPAPSHARSLSLSPFLLQGTLQQFVDDFFRSVLSSGSVVPPAVKYFFDFLDEQALRHDNVDEETLHIWKTNRLLLLLFTFDSSSFSFLAFLPVVFLFLFSQLKAPGKYKCNINNVCLNANYKNKPAALT